MFTCQRDSFLKEIEAEILSCQKIPLDELEKKIKELAIEFPGSTQSSRQNGAVIDEAGDKLAKTLYEIVVSESLLFPEGGGQPDDRGFIDDMPVVRVIRSGSTAVNYVCVEEEKGGQVRGGSKVKVVVDFQRRFDHMQQHSGQHLITAVADELYGYSTKSWWLGSDESFIELDAKDLTQDQINTIEDKVNQCIRDNIPVSVEVVDLDDPKLKTARGRNLPEDVKGNIRIVTMKGIESNVCCGTHVTNLSQLQVIKLLCSKKMKGKLFLYFICGGRVIQNFNKQFEREQKLIGMLNTANVNIPSCVQKLNIDIKNSRKICQTLTKDLVVLEAKKFLENPDKPKFWHYHRDNIEMDFGSSLLQNLTSDKTTLILISLKSVEGNNGSIFLRGFDGFENSHVTQIGESICEILEGKGILRGNTFQAKVSKISAINKALKLAQSLFDQYLNTQK